jgi:hypothetical protein
MIGQYLASELMPGYAVFRARLGLTVIDLVSSTGQAGADRAYIHLISETLAAPDGYAARDVLAHDGCRAKLTDAEERALTSAVRSAGLGLGAIPAPQMADLLAAVKLSETVIERSVDAPTPV